MHSVCASAQNCQRTSADILEYYNLFVLIVPTGTGQLVYSVLFICINKWFFKWTFWESLNLVSKILKVLSCEKILRGKEITVGYLRKTWLLNSFKYIYEINIVAGRFTHCCVFGTNLFFFPHMLQNASVASVGVESPQAVTFGCAERNFLEVNA